MRVFVFALSFSSFVFADDFSHDQSPQLTTDLTTDIKNDLGVHGAVFDVVEEDAIEYLKNRMKCTMTLERLETFKTETKEKITRDLLHPKSTSMPHATKTISFEIDPTYVVNADIKTPSGDVIARRGQRLNPLDHVTPRPLLFIDGNSKDQREMAKKLQKIVMIVMTSGEPLRFEKEIGVPIYFDQQGKLTEKFKVSAVPSIVQAHRQKIIVTQFRCNALKDIPADLLNPLESLSITKP